MVLTPPQRRLFQLLHDKETMGAGRLPMEVKYQRKVDPVRDLRGLQAFRKAVPGLSVLVTREEVTLKEPDTVAIPLSWLLGLR
ncbi:MAG: hypothetical protein AB1758_10010 [Candidatus Eremiobacterota bacterium]